LRALPVVLVMSVLTTLAFYWVALTKIKVVRWSG
jgi:hypothetical protein